MSPTLVRSSDNIRHLTVNLGELKLVLPQHIWHTNAVLEYKIQFENGSIEIPATRLAALVRQAQEALAATPGDVNCSGACADMEEPT